MIYYVEDDANIRDLAVCTLSQAGFETRGFPDTEPFFAACERQLPDVVLLDIMLPGIDGLEVCRRIRRVSSVPILMITAKDEDADRILGLDIGADDYISKPFSIREVIARIKAVLRRIVEKEDPAILQFEKLYIDPVKKRAFIDSTELPLTKKEFEILSLLLSHPGQVFSREEILSKIWTDEVYVLDRTIDVNITRLRKKIGEYGKRIVTRLGYGYCFETA